MTAVRVYVVDDHPVVLDGLRAALGNQEGIEVVGTAPSAEAALVALAGPRRVAADVVLVDACLPGMSGPDLCIALRTPAVAVRCLVLTGTLDKYLLSAAIEAGARGFLVKDVGIPEIAAAIRRVHEGEIVLDPRATGLVVEQFRSPDRARISLTPREYEVVDFLAAGMSNPAIARRLRISPSTAKSYVSRLLVKLDAATRTAAVARAAELGLLKTAPTQSPWSDA
jgi:DNA-binding NarL/FixJ family response regulator